MHDTRLELKDGTVYVGPIWSFNPEQGWCSLVLDPMNYDHEPPERFYLRDIALMVTKGQRTGKDIISDQDELHRARKQGWDGT